jgi:hypothetical protein
VGRAKPSICPTPETRYAIRNSCGAKQRTRYLSVARSIVARAKFVSRIDAAASHALLKGAQGKGKRTDEHIARVQVCVESSRQKQPGLLAKGKDAINVVSGTAP